jgi:predicted acylesterase/phospholipase RssA
MAQADKGTQRQVLVPITLEKEQPLWPIMPSFKNEPTNLSRNKPVQSSQAIAHTSSPSRSKRTPDERPWIATIWSGGVFRGVFQIGAINAYNEAEVKPRIFAGTSVGSIMAALAARVASLPEYESKVTIQKAAATFISLDRLVLTDRFADLVRRLTIRANDVHLTPKSLDHVFRRFELQNNDRFNKNVRRVAAGFERFLYMSPFELLELTQALHNMDGATAVKLMRDAIDYFFERSGAGLELLGAEPLHMLITEHVLEQIDADTQRTLTVGQYLEGLPWINGQKDLSYKPRPYLLISTTDLTNGTLEVIGSDSLESPQDEDRIKRGSDALLVEALLAGSAFPAVFRPRRRSEVYPTVHKGSVFVDGGIMDNLPLDPVVRFMKNASETGAGLLRRRPSNPHLILTASLERRVNDIPLDDEKLGSFDRDWRALTRRVTELQYNRKVMVFTKAQRHFRFIHDHAPRNDVNAPLNYVVGTIKPEWLCGTFAFHPMLGFSQVKQAGSIAHGCAMTLATLSLLAERSDADRWGIQMGPIEPKGFCSAPYVEMENDDFLDEKVPPDRIVSTEYLNNLCPDQRLAKTECGHCWFRRGVVCPFSPQGLQKWDGNFPQATRRALTMIYDLCGQASTHLRHDE